MTQLSDFPPDVQALARKTYERRPITVVGIAVAIMADRQARVLPRIGGLTAHQKHVLDFIRSYAAQHQISPSYEEIRVFLGLASKSSVHRVIHELADRGAIEHRPDRSRAITIIATPPIGA